MRVIPVILCGGSGKRLWPLSRESYPKQFLPLTSKNTLFQETLTRFNELKNINFSKPIIISNDEHRFIIAEQIKQIGIEQEAIILEPIGRNTAPAIAAVTEYLFQNGSEEALLLILPSDHLIHDIESFGAAIENAINTSDKFDFTLFGIVPNGPNTNYGYIKKGQNSDESNYHIVEKFVEKPNHEDADKFYKSGNYLWNSGMFLFKNTAYADALEEYAPNIKKYASESVKKAKSDQDFFRLDKASFEQCTDISIDYAVMEKILSTKTDISAISLDAGWDDLGSFSSLWANSKLDEKKNSISGDVITESTASSFLYSESGLLAAVGVDDLIIINMSDAVLVASKSESEKIANIVKSLNENQREEAVFHRKVTRPWGTFDSTDEDEGFKVKRLTVNPKAKLSLQMHHKREEFWVVVNGTAKVTKGEDIILLDRGEYVHIPLGMTHSIENPSDQILEIIEVQMGDYLGEDDIVRFDDVYGRVEK